MKIRALAWDPQTGNQVWVEGEQGTLITSKNIKTDSNMPTSKKTSGSGMKMFEGYWLQSAEETARYLKQRKAFSDQDSESPNFTLYPGTWSEEKVAKPEKSLEEILPNQVVRNRVLGALSGK